MKWDLYLRADDYRRSEHPSGADLHNGLTPVCAPIPGQAPRAGQSFDEWRNCLSRRRLLARVRCTHVSSIFRTLPSHLGAFVGGLGKIVSGVFTPVLAKHSKSFSLIDCISVGVDRMQRNFEPMQKQVEAWQRSELTDVTAKVVIYEAFVEGRLEAPKHLARTVHDLYFEPKYEEF